MVDQKQKDAQAQWQQVRSEFKVVGKLNLENGLLKWDWNASADKDPCVYVMVLSPEGMGDQERVIYVGMASNGWQERAKQHNSGLSSVNRKVVKNGRATKHYEERKNWLEKGRQITVYARKAQLLSLHGENAYTHHAEEHILIKLLEPEHNYRPRVRH